MEELQKLLKLNQIKYYIVPTDDDHQSEYVGDYYQFRSYLSGFDGSAGTLLVGWDKAYLWTDGRYFLQAERQLNPDIQLMKMGDEKTPSLLEFLADNISENDILGFDAKVMRTSLILELQKKLDFSLRFKDIDFSYIWKDRPEKSHEEAIIYDIQYHGRSTLEKLEDIREYMSSNDCDFHIVSSLDDIAWIFNIRGSDITYCPTVLSFAIIGQEKASLYLQKGTYDEQFIEVFKKIKVSIKDYDSIYDDVSKLGGTVLCDFNRMNYALYDSIEAKIVNSDNPSQYFKAIKNDIEIKNTKKAHIKDGVAVTKFMYWLKNEAENETELSIQEKLLSFRKKQKLFMQPSFATICGYKDHGAIVHYHSTEETNVIVKKEGLLLIDSGGQYLDGTTDITRMFVMGDLTDRERRDFTLVLKGFLNLMHAEFLYGTNGTQLDILARMPLARYGLDFRHGTGHGIGHFLNVHEGPQSIRPRNLNGTPIAFEAGMITSDEPGVYIAGSHGIRHENELLCVNLEKNEYGQFMGFETITYVPIDLDGVDISLLNEEEKNWLNEYHQMVYDKIHTHLTKKEEQWLKHYTRKI